MESMKSFFTGLAISTAFIVGGACSHLAVPKVAAEDYSAKIPAGKYQYECAYSSRYGVMAKETTKLLNKYISEAWEYNNMIRSSQNIAMVCFKRKK